jgi:Trk K+ transport system NAD-binding subunit
MSWIPSISQPTRRLLLLAAFVPVVTLLGALVYMLGMDSLEGRPRGFWQALSWAGETITTTGYGGDHNWNHPLMILFVVSLQFLGVLLIYLVFPFYLIPVLEERFESRLPRIAPEMEDHLVIFRYGPAVSTLIDSARARDIPVLIIESDEAEARRLIEEGHEVLFGDLDEGVLQRARLDRARALVANGRDDEDAAVMLTARQLGFAGEALALVEEPYHRKPMALAGASAVYTPRHILGAALAARASAKISPRVAGVQRLGDRLEVREVRLEEGSELVGRTLREAGIGARTGATVIGQWVRGRLISQPTADMELAAHGILVTVGSESSLERLQELSSGAVALRADGPFLVGGYGEVGKKVVQLLQDAGEPTRVVDRQPGPGVDVVGDILDPRLLEEARVREARAIVLALDTDSSTLFATVILNELVPDVPVIARVNRGDNVERIHMAGADFALSISQVSGQMLVKKLLGEESVAVDPQLSVSRLRAPGLDGSHPTELHIRERTGCSAVAVERGDEVVVELADPDFRFASEDMVYVSGSPEAVKRFRDEFG